MKRLACIALLAAALGGNAAAQTQIDLLSQPSVEVQRLAPQLVTFAGGEVNFTNLANGLALGLPVTLTTAVAPGITQVVTFTPAAPMTPLVVSQILEAVRQQMISLGIATPTAQQLGVALVGGTLATPAGNVPLAGVVAINGPLAANTLGVQPTSTSFLPGISNSLAPRNISDSPFPRGISDSPFPRGISDTPARPVQGLVIPGSSVSTTPMSTPTTPFAAPTSTTGAAAGSTAPSAR